MTSRPAAPSRSPSPVAPRGSLALPLANARRSRHIILLLFSPYLELLSRQFRPRARPPSPVCVWYPQVRGTFFFFFLSACTCVLSACVCVFWGFVGARRGELGWEEGKKPQSSRAPATSPPPVLSSLRAPRQQGRRPLLIRDAADPLENRGPLRRGFQCRLELGCQGSLFAPTEPGVPPRPWEGLAAAAGADETAGSPLREAGGGVEAPSLGSSPHPRSSSRHLGGLLPFSSRRELRARPPLGSDPRAPDAPGCPDAPPSSLIVLIDP